MESAKGTTCPDSSPAASATLAWSPRGDARGDWRSGSALRSHRRGHWFEPSIAHNKTAGQRHIETTEKARVQDLVQK